MAPASIDKSLVRDRIASARRRLSDFLALGDNISSLPHERQQLVQEFFFHLVGAIEMVAQLVNQGRLLGKSAETVHPLSVANALPTNDPIKPLLISLYAQPKRDPMPADPYSDEGYVWRAWNYRHQVSHRGRNPFLFRVGATPPASLVLDPRNSQARGSIRPVQDELQDMLGLIEERCEAILDSLP